MKKFYKLLILTVFSVLGSACSTDAKDQSSQSETKITEQNASVDKTITPDSIEYVFDTKNQWTCDSIPQEEFTQFCCPLLR